MNKPHSKFRTTYYRRIYVAYLIDSGVNSVPQLLAETGMPKRTLEDVLKALGEMDIKVLSHGGTKTRTYSIKEWGGINKEWIEKNLHHISSVVQCSYS